MLRGNADTSSNIDVSPFSSGGMLQKINVQGFSNFVCGKKHLHFNQPKQL